MKSVNAIFDSLEREASVVRKAFFIERVKGAGFRGLFCNRRQPRPDNMMAAHEIARDHFDVESGDANIAALKYLLRYQQAERRKRTSIFI